MSIHRSLKLAGALARRRNVLTRGERIIRMRTEERWEDGRSVFGLPKVKVSAPRRARKDDKKKAEEVEEGAEATEATEEASEQ